MRIHNVYADENGEITFGGFLNLIPQEGFGFSNNPTAQFYSAV